MKPDSTLAKTTKRNTRAHPKYTPSQVELALRTTHGCVYAAARALQCHPETVYRYMRRYPSVQRARDESRELRLDLAELRLDQAVQAGQAWAVCFFLKTQGRRRGYSERFEYKEPPPELKPETKKWVDKLSDKELHLLVSWMKRADEDADAPAVEPGCGLT